MWTSRRSVLQGIGSLAGMRLLAACGGSKASDEPGSGGTTQEVEASGMLEIFSWWAGVEAPPLDAVLALYSQRHPKVKLVNSAIEGAAGANVLEALTTRLSQGNPPDVFLAQAGRSFIKTDVLANGTDPSGSYVESLTSLYEKEGWLDVVSPAMRELVSYDSEYYAVPFDILRGNSLYYDKKLFEREGLTPPRTWEEFYAVAEVLKGKGIVPLAISTKDAWAVKDTWLYVFLSKIGAPGYRRFFEGKGDHHDPAVEAATAEFHKLLGYSNATPELLEATIPDAAKREKVHASNVSWAEAAGLLLDGTAAMTIMGDWCKGLFTALTPWKPGVDLGGAPVPGTEGHFIAIVDTFSLARAAANKENGRLFLKLLGSREGQDAFNLLKGSIPVRSDADLSKYDAVSQATAAQYKAATAAGQVAPGIGMILPNSVNVAFDVQMFGWYTLRQTGSSITTLTSYLTSFFESRYSVMREY